MLGHQLLKKRSRPFVDSSLILRDWSLIMGRGGYKMGKSRVRNFLRPPSRQGKTFRPPPLLKSGNFSCPPAYNKAKTSSYHVKTTPKLFVPPPFSMAKTFSAPPFRRGKTSRAPPPPSRFVAPPLPVISDQSLTSTECGLAFHHCFVLFCKYWFGGRRENMINYFDSVSIVM